MNSKCVHEWVNVKECKALSTVVLWEGKRIRILAMQQIWPALLFVRWALKLNILLFIIIIWCKHLLSSDIKNPTPPHDGEWHLTSMHCQASKKLIHLGSPVKSEKYTALIFVDTLKSVWGWLLLFLRFLRATTKNSWHGSDSWQKQACRQHVQGVNKCF